MAGRTVETDTADALVQSARGLRPRLRELQEEHAAAGATTRRSTTHSAPRACTASWPPTVRRPGTGSRDVPAGRDRDLPR